MCEPIKPQFHRSLYRIVDSLGHMLIVSSEHSHQKPGDLLREKVGEEKINELILHFDDKLNPSGPCCDIFHPGTKQKKSRPECE